MSLLVVLLVLLSLIILGAAAGKPLGWIAIGLSVLALIVQLTGHLR